MSLQGIPVSPSQKIPGAVIDDLRDYAAKLKLPADWTKQVTITKVEHGPTGQVAWNVDYDGKPLASYKTDMLREIEYKTHHIPLPPAVDPLVVATELALIQPSNPEFRRFNDCVFRVSEIAAIDGKCVKDGVRKLRVLMKNGTEFACENEANYANSGMSTFEFFLTHVMELAPEHRHQP